MAEKNCRIFRTISLSLFPVIPAVRLYRDRRPIAELSLIRGDHVESVAMAVRVDRVQMGHSPVGQRYIAANILARAVAVDSGDPVLKLEPVGQPSLMARRSNLFSSRAVVLTATGLRLSIEFPGRVIPQTRIS
ncbi:MAG: hypothetical protein VB835_12480 [Pirellulales bacterium]